MYATIRPRFVLFVLVGAIIGLGCANPHRSADTTSTEGRMLELDTQDAIAAFKERDESLGKWFDEAYGYAVFPSIGKGAIGVGGAHGDGRVFEQGRYVGAATMSQVTIGFQLGGQEYREVIFFKDNAAFADFVDGNFEFSGQASAVAARSGAAATADYEGGVAVFTMPMSGLMFEANIGGQKFEYAKAP